MLTPTSFEARHWSGCIWFRNWPDAADDEAAEPALEPPEPLVCASAGAAMKAVATRHAAICFFSMGSSVVIVRKHALSGASRRKRRSPPEVHLFRIAGLFRAAKLLPASSQAKKNSRRDG